MIYIIIINWNQYNHTANCIRSLQSISYSEHRIIVVDNASSDGSAEKLEKEFSSQVDLILHKINTGFTGGSNAGIQYALAQGAQYIMLLNNDTIVHHNFIEPLMEQIRLNPAIGVVTPKIYYLNNSKTNRIWAAGGETTLWMGISRSRGRGQIDNGQFNSVQEVDYASGCCLLTTRDVLEEVGLLTNSYFAYYEDVDWCFRAKQMGYQIMYVPQSSIWHSVGSSGKTHPSGEGVQSPFVHYLNSRNHIWFLRTHARGLIFYSAFLYYIINHLFYYSIAFIILNRRRKLKELWRGFIDGVTKTPNDEIFV